MSRGQKKPCTALCNHYRAYYNWKFIIVSYLGGGCLFMESKAVMLPTRPQQDGSCLITFTSENGFEKGSYWKYG